jgi:hypothetical protein
MRRTLAALVGSAMGLTLNAWESLAQSAGDLSFPKTQVQCILDRIDAFLDEPDDPVIIYLDLCLSSPSQLARSVAGSVRVDIPTVPTAPRAAGGAKPAPSISVPKAILRCLKSSSAAPGFPTADPVQLTATCP